MVVGHACNRCYSTRRTARGGAEPSGERGHTAGMFSVLFVCTGNRIRSPLAEASLRRAVGAREVEVASAGTLDAEGPRSVPEALVAAERLDLDLSGHVPRPLHGIDVKRFDLVIGFQLSHVATAVVERGAVAERTFLLRELVRLLHDVYARERAFAGRGPAAVAKANALRAAAPRFDPGDVIEDPIGRGQAAATRCAEEINGLCNELALLMWGGAR